MTFEIYFFKNWMTTVPKEKSPSFNFIPYMLKEIEHLAFSREKIHDQELRSLQYLGYIKMF